MKKLIKFSLKIDDDDHSLSKENGLPFDKLAILLKDLYEAIDSKTGIKCTLGQIRGNCYALDFFTEDLRLHNNFKAVHKNLEIRSGADLRNKEQKYANTLSHILGDRLYIKAYDRSGKQVAKLRNLSAKREVEFYFITQTVYGIFSEHGGRDLETKPHIFISGKDYKIAVTPEQDLALKSYYKTDEIKFRLRLKKAAKDNRIISADLIDFEPRGTKSLLENLNQIEPEKLKGMNDINSNDDILRKLYGY